MKFPIYRGAGRDFRTAPTTRKRVHRKKKYIYINIVVRPLVVPRFAQNLKLPIIIRTRLFFPGSMADTSKKHISYE